MHVQCRAVEPRMRAPTGTNGRGPPSPVAQAVRARRGRSMRSGDRSRTDRRAGRAVRSILDRLMAVRWRLGRTAPVGAPFTGRRAASWAHVRPAAEQHGLARGAARLRRAVVLDLDVSILAVAI